MFSLPNWLVVIILIVLGAIDDAIPEVCDNGIDDDFNGDIDCADFECAGDPTCLVPCPDDALEGPDNNEELATAKGLGVQPGTSVVVTDRWS